MSNRPTADELGQEFAKLEKVYAEAVADCTHAMQQMVAALSNPNFYYIDEKGQGGNKHSRAWGEASSLALDKQKQAKRALDKVKKQAWKWYGVAL